MNIKIIAATATTNSIKPRKHFLTYVVSFEINEELLLKHNLIKKRLNINQIEFIKLLKDIKPSPKEKCIRHLITIKPNEI